MQRIAVLTAVAMVIGAPDVRAGVTLVGSGAGMTSLAEGVARRESNSGRDWQEAIYLTGQTGPAVTGDRVKSPWTNSGVEQFDLSFDASARRMTWRVGDSDADASFGGPIAWTLSAPSVSGLLLRLSGNFGVADVSGVLVSVDGESFQSVEGLGALRASSGQSVEAVLSLGGPARSVVLRGSVRLDAAGANGSGQMQLSVGLVQAPLSVPGPGSLALLGAGGLLLARGGKSRP